MWQEGVRIHPDTKERHLCSSFFNFYLFIYDQDFSCISLVLYLKGQPHISPLKVDLLALVCLIVVLRNDGQPWPSRAART